MEKPAHDYYVPTFLIVKLMKIISETKLIYVEDITKW